MIGVTAGPSEHEVVREFFELFKTPWEFCRSNRRYDVLIHAGEGQPEAEAKLVIVYAGRKTSFDDNQKAPVSSQRRGACAFAYRGNRIPIYGETVRFSTHGSMLLTDAESRESSAYLEKNGGACRARVGYDLFGEVRTLLTAGQSKENASIPALELHIAFLRDLIAECGISFAEIPPIPEGYQFIACLTHDIDHPSIRQHKMDLTVGGFLLRAGLISIADTLRGRMSVSDLHENWAAVLKLPLVHLGLAKDFWRDFDDRYFEIEKGLPSTFFVIPRKNDPGKRANGSAPALRATRYEAKEIADKISRLRSAGREVGLHGIDAWVDPATGRQELEEIRRLTGFPEVGVRMHWLYFDENSPRTLEQAGAAYDSTVGFNQTVGFKAGTTQVYKLFGAEHLFELPMHAMDTALFYLSYLGLPPEKASERLRELTEQVAQHGGCFTVNWHDRSLAPERLWVGCYRELLHELKTRGAWFATASQATAWFRKRRSVEFEMDGRAPGVVSARVTGDRQDNLPGLRLRIHEARELDAAESGQTGSYLDMRIDEGAEVDFVSRGRAMSGGSETFVASKDDPILITGAGGFIGSRVVEGLLDRGFRNLVCFARPTSNLARIEHSVSQRPQGSRVKVVKGNLLSRQDCEAASKDVALIYHLAAGTGEKSYPDAVMNSVVTTRNLLDASLTQGRLRRFVLVSSFTVYSNRNKPGGKLLDESCPLEDRPDLRGEAYCYGKLKQEEIVAEYGKKFGMPYVIVRPGSVYGDGSHSITGRVGIDTFGIFLHLGGSNTIPFTFVENCSEAIILAGLVKGMDGEIFNVVDDDLPSSRQFLRSYKKNVRDFRSVYVPHAVSHALCFLWESYSDWSGGQLPRAFNLRRWHNDWKKTRYTNNKLKTRLGWIQKIPTWEAMRRYFQSCRRAAENA